MDAWEVGHWLFGRKSRLPLALWIYLREEPRFYQSEPPRELVVQSEVARELDRLVRLGMLDRERPDEARRVYYVRTDSALWTIIAAAANVVDPPEVGR